MLLVAAIPFVVWAVNKCRCLLRRKRCDDDTCCMDDEK